MSLCIRLLMIKRKIHLVLLCFSLCALIRTCNTGFIFEVQGKSLFKPSELAFISHSVKIRRRLVHIYRWSLCRIVVHSAQVVPVVWQLPKSYTTRFINVGQSFIGTLENLIDFNFKMFYSKTKVYVYISDQFLLTWNISRSRAISPRTVFDAGIKCCT